MLALEHLSKTANPVGYIDHPVRYDGCRWSYHAHRITSGSSPVRGLGREASLNRGSRGCYSHFTYHFGGFAYRRMMTDREINICEEILTGKEITDRDAAASAIAKGYVARKADGEFFVAVPAFTKMQRKPSTGWPNRLLPLPSALTRTRFLPMYPDTGGCFLPISKIRLPAPVIICSYSLRYGRMRYGAGKGLLSPPASNSVCDVLIQFKQPAEALNAGKK